MNVGYLIRELYYQKRRTLTAILGLSIGIALLDHFECPFYGVPPSRPCSPEGDRGGYNRTEARGCAQGPCRGGFPLLRRDDP